MMVGGDGHDSNLHQFACGCPDVFYDVWLVIEPQYAFPGCRVWKFAFWSVSPVLFCPSLRAMCTPFSYMDFPGYLYLEWSQIWGS